LVLLERAGCGPLQQRLEGLTIHRLARQLCGEIFFSGEIQTRPRSFSCCLTFCEVQPVEDLAPEKLAMSHLAQQA
jgi:hypothetical protein